MISRIRTSRLTPPAPRYNSVVALTPAPVYDINTGHELGAVGAVVSVASTVSGIMKSGVLKNLFGGSRDEKRKKRDQALNELYALGMNRNIVLGHSDNWGVVRAYADLAQQYGKPVIDTLNRYVTAESDGVRRIHSDNSEQFKMLETKITEAIMQSQGASASSIAAATSPSTASFAGGINLKNPIVLGVIGLGAVSAVAFAIKNKKKK